MCADQVRREVACAPDEVVPPRQLLMSSPNSLHNVMKRCFLTVPVRADRVKAHVRQIGLIALGEQQLDVSALAQLVELSQTRAIAEALQLLHQVGRPLCRHVRL